MMKLGIFSKTFDRPSLEENLDAVKEYGLDTIQFNLVCAGLASLPEKIDLDTAKRIQLESRKRGITISAVSGTFNMIHPDPRIRKEGINRLRNLAAMCRDMGTSKITLCTGTRDPHDMWRRHPENDSRESWEQLLTSMKEALAIAEQYDLYLAFEPEYNNIIDDANKGKLLLDTMESSRLKVVMDGANLFRPNEFNRMSDIMYEAFELLGEHIIIAHAKDFMDGNEVKFQAAGTGQLDYDGYISLLSSYTFHGPLIIHGLDESQVTQSVTYIRSKLARIE